MSNPYNPPGVPTGLLTPKFWRSATPDDDTDLNPIGIGLMNNADAEVTVAIRMVDGSQETFRIQAGQYFPVSVRRVLQTGTDSGADIKVAYDR